MEGGYMKESSRMPTAEEMGVIEFLVDKGGYSKGDWRRGLRVIDMPGGMGSLRISYDDKDSDRKLGDEVSSVRFKDIDGVDVIMTLYVDTEGKLYELDVWKVDFTDLIRMPERL
jgi:hypothetical protein